MRTPDRTRKALQREREQASGLRLVQVLLPQEQVEALDAVASAAGQSRKAAAEALLADALARRASQA